MKRRVAAKILRRAVLNLAIYNSLIYRRNTFNTAFNKLATWYSGNISSKVAVMVEVPELGMLWRCSKDPNLAVHRPRAPRPAQAAH